VNQPLTHGLPAVAVAAALYGCAPVVQAAAARQTPPGGGLGLLLLARLAVRPLWLLGLGCEICGFAAEAYAFSVAPATLVAPLLTQDVVFLVLLARRGLDERLAVTGRCGIFAMVLGTGLMAYAFSDESVLGSPASDAQMLGFVIGGAVVAGAGAVVGDRGTRAGRSWVAALGFGAAAGVAYGIATLATRQVGLTFDVHDPWPTLITPTPYVLAACSVLAISLLQRGLQAGAAVLTFPVTSFLSSLVPVVLGTTALGDEVPGHGEGAAFGVALLAVAVGVTCLGRDRAAAADSIEAGTDLDPRRAG
jgi:hypothetical protein